MISLFICEICDSSYPDKEDALACEESCKKAHDKWTAEYNAKEKEEAEEDAKELCYKCKYKVTNFYSDPYKTCQQCEKGSNFEEGKKITCWECGGSGISKDAFAHCRKCKGLGYWYE